jgi:ABC-2 type transport system ATP-binding protein
MPRERKLLVETRSPEAFYARLPALSLEDGTAITEVYSEDDNMEAVFKYLVSK